MIPRITKMEFISVCFSSLFPDLLRNDDTPRNKDGIHKRKFSIFVTSTLFLFLVYSSNYTLNTYETQDIVRSVATSSRVHKCCDRININFVRPQIATCCMSLIHECEKSHCFVSLCNLLNYIAHRPRGVHVTTVL